MTTDEERQRAMGANQAGRGLAADRDATIVGQAAEWLLANRNEPDPARQAAFVAWLRAAPAHAQAYSDALRVASTLYRALPQPPPPIEELVPPKRQETANVSRLEPAPPPGLPAHSRRRWLYALAAAVIPLVALPPLVSVWMNRRPVPPVAVEPGEHFATGHGQQLVQVLSDGSVLHLNTDTAVTVRYLASRRGVELEHGQVVFNVAHDPARPFRVIAGTAQVTAVGTQFDVYLQNEATVVTVVEGKVAVASVANSDRSALLVGAGEQVRVVRGELPAGPSAVDPSRSTAWLNRQISFRHEPLSQVVAEFNRYATTPIRIESPGLGDLPVSGVFNVDDTESMVAFLRSLAGVKVEVTPSAIRVSGG